MKHFANNADTLALEAADLQNVNGGNALVPVASGNAYNPVTGSSGPILYGPASGGSKPLPTSIMIVPPDMWRVIY